MPRHDIQPARSDSVGLPSSVAPTRRAPGTTVGLGWHQGKAPELTGPAAPGSGGGASFHAGEHGTRYDRTLSDAVGHIGALLVFAAILFTVLTELPLQWVAQFCGAAP